jgi:hypothetical protein
MVTPIAASAKTCTKIIMKTRRKMCRTAFLPRWFQNTIIATREIVVTAHRRISVEKSSKGNICRV